MTDSQGQPMSDLTFLRPDGTSLKLPDLQAEVLVLIFLRHLG